MSSSGPRARTASRARAQGRAKRVGLKGFPMLGQTQLALQVLDVLLKQEPEHVAGRSLRLQLLETLCAGDHCLMSRNAWVYFMEQDRAFLESAK